MEDAAGILSRDALIGLNAYWRQKQLFYDALDNLEYIGFHAQGNAPTSDSNWAILKLTYTGTNLTSVEGPMTGVLDDRATLSWL